MLSSCVWRYALNDIIGGCVSAVWISLHKFIKIMFSVIRNTKVTNLLYRERTWWFKPGSPKLSHSSHWAKSRTTS
jgi:hypothetical protein